MHVDVFVCGVGGEKNSGKFSDLDGISCSIKNGKFKLSFGKLLLPKNFPAAK